VDISTEHTDSRYIALYILHVLSI